MKAKKHLGQHFLTSKKALSDMIKAASVIKDDTVLEIGPGKGVLTTALLETGAKVIAIETDPDMMEVLNEKFPKEILSKQLTLIEGDILDLNIKNYVTGEYKLVANIPYYITGEILRRFLSSDYQPSSITVLVQKEVAERIAKSKKETILSLSIKAYGKPFYIATVPARYFTPKPKVDSAVLHIANISKDFFTELSEERFFKLIKAGFSSKRKKLINNLSAFGSKDFLEKTLTSLGLHTGLRAEDIRLEDWERLAIEL
ncbi:ribosomal RNA small subunit methyltransferase A [Candidatus Kaiserbacteria bacterium]|nr:MAG: ribosomal RNA small subunit methyltransferase A [Candidatus Kaiserbacteria bacterium]